MTRPLQQGLLILFLVLAGLVLIMMWMGITWGAYQPAPMDYPDAAAVPGWHAEQWKPLIVETKDRPRAISGAIYEYRLGDTVLLAEVRYLDRATADVASYAERRTALSLEGEVRQTASGQFHQVAANEGTAWLNACLDAMGHATVTPEQFDANRKFYDRTFRRLALWSLAVQPLEDRRCLWFHLSIPIHSRPKEEAFQLLESFWTDWQVAWRGRIPSSPRG